MQFPDPDQAVYYIFEFTATWPEDHKNWSEYKLELVQTKVLVPREREVMKLFLPNIDAATLDIDGSKLGLTKGMVTIRNSESWLFKDCSIFGNIYEYVNSGGKQSMVLVTEAQLTTQLQFGLTFEEKYLILERAQRTLVNTVPYNRTREAKSISTDLFGASNYYMPQELLGGHCAIEFMLGNNAVVENSHWRSPIRTKDSYLKKLLSGYAKKDKLFNELRKYNCFAAHEMEIHSDLSMRNVIQSCLDFDKPQAMFEKANYFMEIIFNME